MLENVGSMDLQNVGNLPCHYMVSQTDRQTDKINFISMYL